MKKFIILLVITFALFANTSYAHWGFSRTYNSTSNGYDSFGGSDEWSGSFGVGPFTCHVQADARVDIPLDSITQNATADATAVLIFTGGYGSQYVSVAHADYDHQRDGDPKTFLVYNPTGCTAYVSVTLANNGTGSPYAEGSGTISW